MITNRLISIFAKYFPSIFRKLVQMDIINEPSWVNLKLDIKNGQAAYLKDEHRNRTWFCDFIGLLKGPAILEIGAGGMFEIATLKTRGKLADCSYHIIDISDEVISEGKKLHTEVDFKRGSINKIPYPDNTFNVVYCRHVIEHQPDYKEAVSEMLRVSKDIVIINLFRWSLSDPILERKKKISNSYNIHSLLDYCRRTSTSLDYFILLYGETPGHNQYDNLDIVRSKDHLILFLSKTASIYSNELKKSLGPYRTYLYEHPYDTTPPTYAPQVKLAQKPPL
ncbi:MAG TPA: methyltransferase domain-containing protein [Elusimicrobiota bacterium]|nr:methyltransferase domain-containing protein [Elusimicrobiota bacterium]